MAMSPTLEADMVYEQDMDTYRDLVHMSKMELNKVGRTYSHAKKGVRQGIKMSKDNFGFVLGKESMHVVPVSKIVGPCTVINSTFSCNRDKHGIMVIKSKTEWENVHLDRMREEIGQMEQDQETDKDQEEQEDGQSEESGKDSSSELSSLLSVETKKRKTDGHRQRKR